MNWEHSLVMCPCDDESRPLEKQTAVTEMPSGVAEGDAFELCYYIVLVIMIAAGGDHVRLVLKRFPPF